MVIHALIIAIMLRNRHNKLIRIKSAFIQSLQHLGVFQSFHHLKQQQQQSTALLPNIKSQLSTAASYSCFLTAHQLQLLLNSSSPNKHTLRA
jgi:hypothetical protein